MKNWITQGERKEGFPTIHIVSDSLGKTAQAVARAAASSFDNPTPFMEIRSEITDAQTLSSELNEHLMEHRRAYGDKAPFLVFYTVVEPEMRKVLHAFEADNEQVLSVDILDESVNVLARATGKRPVGHVGAVREVNDQYFKRIEAVEFTISHDDGRNPQDLTEADIVLIGVSRSSKTPLSIYLSQMGYRVANIPLDPKTNPPEEVYDVDPTRLFGLMTSPEVLVDIRKKRLGAAQAAVAGSYADYEKVCQDLDKSRALMRKLGCIVVRTDRRAIEETAQEILRYYSASHPLVLEPAFI